MSVMISPLRRCPSGGPTDAAIVALLDGDARPGDAWLRHQSLGVPWVAYPPGGGERIPQMGEPSRREAYCPADIEFGMTQSKRSSGAATGFVSSHADHDNGAVLRICLGPDNATTLRLIA
jgi:hypothetical protein